VGDTAQLEAELGLIWVRLKGGGTGENAGI